MTVAPKYLTSVTSRLQYVLRRLFVDKRLFMCAHWVPQQLDSMNKHWWFTKVDNHIGVIFANWWVNERSQPVQQLVWRYAVPEVEGAESARVWVAVGEHARHLACRDVERVQFVKQTKRCGRHARWR